MKGLNTVIPTTSAKPPEAPDRAALGLEAALGRLGQKATIRSPRPVRLALQIINRIPDIVVLVHDREGLLDLVAIFGEGSEFDAAVAIDRRVALPDHRHEGFGVGEERPDPRRRQRVSALRVVMRKSVELPLYQRARFERRGFAGPRGGCEQREADEDNG